MNRFVALGIAGILGVSAVVPVLAMHSDLVGGSSAVTELSHQQNDNARGGDADTPPTPTATPTGSPTATPGNSATATAQAARVQRCGSDADELTPEPTEGPDELTPEPTEGPNDTDSDAAKDAAAQGHKDCGRHLGHGHGKGKGKGSDHLTPEAMETETEHDTDNNSHGKAVATAAHAAHTPDSGDQHGDNVSKVARQHHVTAPLLP